MGFRDGLLKAANEPLPFKLVATRFGDVKIMPPMAGRVDEFRKFFAEAKDSTGSMDSQGVLMALSCHDTETGLPLFAPADVATLNKLPSAMFNRINEAISELSGEISLDPTTPGIATGSDSVSGTGEPSTISATA